MPGPATALLWRTLAAALALLSLSLTGCAAADTASDVAQKRATPSASATPSADALKAAYEESLLSGEELTTHFLVPAGLGDQELAETFMAKLDEWRNYGATPEFDAWMDADFNKYEESIAWATSRNTPAIAAALVVPDWRTLALGPDERPLRIQYTEYANTDRNRASELSESLVTAEGHYATMNVVFKEIDGHAVVRWLSFDSIDMRTEQ